VKPAQPFKQWRGGTVNDDQADFRIQYDFWK
jgi:hypothetical protein